MPQSMPIRACMQCGLAQRVPTMPAGSRACCARCGATLRGGEALTRSNTTTAALALAALVLYPAAVTLPILKVRQLGNATASSIVDGVITLLADGEIVVGLIVLFCSVILPLGKLAALTAMSLFGERLARSHRAFTYRVIDFTGRWGMLDVLAVAVLVAALKLGDMMDVTPGPGAVTFTLCVLLSLLASASFDAHAVWRDRAGEAVSAGAGTEVA